MLSTFLYIVLLLGQLILGVMLYIVLHHLTGLKRMNQKTLDLLNAINDATNAVAARLTALQGQIVPGMTQEDVDALNTQLQSEVDKLTAIATPADPSTAPSNADSGSTGTMPPSGG